MPTKKTLLVPALVAIALLLAVVGYVTSYLALVEPSPNYYTIRTGGSALLVSDGVDDSYHFAHSYLRWVYWPANQIDRRLRPDTWD